MLVGVPQRNGSVAVQPGLSQPVGDSAPPCMTTRPWVGRNSVDESRSAPCFYCRITPLFPDRRLMPAPRQMAFDIRDFMKAKSASTCHAPLAFPHQAGKVSS